MLSTVFDILYYLNNNMLLFYDDHYSYCYCFYFLYLTGASLILKVFDFILDISPYIVNITQTQRN